MENYDKYIDKELFGRFEFHNYGHALEILHEAFPEKWRLPDPGNWNQEGVRGRIWKT